LKKSDIVDFFKLNSLFQNITDTSLNRLVQSSYIKNFDVNQHLFFQGDRAEALYVILEGQVSIETVSLNGRSMVLNILPSGHMIGELALFDGGDPRYYESRYTKIAANEFAD